MMNALKSYLWEEELKELFDNLLQHAMMMNRTKAGTLQLINEENHSLEIVCSYGLSTEFVEHFKIVSMDDGSFCGRALRKNCTIYVDDLTKDSAFARHMLLALQNNVVAVQSTPLKTCAGHVIGMISVHFSSPARPSSPR